MENDKNARKGIDGFTLVELVVVIAILGILAGVAYAGYGGYLKYAKRAGDDDLIAAVNEAFASACEEQGVARANLGFNDATLDAKDMNSNDTIEGINSVYGVTDLESFKKIFDEYFGKNKGTALKYYDAKQIKFIGGEELFSADPSKTMMAASNIESVRDLLGDMNGLSQNFADTLKNLLGKDFVKDLIGNQNLSGLLKTFKGIAGFGLDDDLANYGLEFLLKVTDEDLNDLEEFAKSHEMLEETLQNNPTGIANTLTLWLAQRATKNGGSSSINDYLNGDLKDKDAILNYAMQFADLEGYCQSEDSEGSNVKQQYKDALANKSFKGMSDALKAMYEEEGYKQYKESGKQADDLKGYLSVLFYIEQNSGSLSKDQLSEEDLFSEDMISKAEEYFK